MRVMRGHIQGSYIWASSGDRITGLLDYDYWITGLETWRLGFGGLLDYWITGFGGF